MKPFHGFTDNESFTQVPDAFFRGLLSVIADPDELKVTLYALWRIGHMEGSIHALHEGEFDGKELGLSMDEVRSGIEKAVRRRSLLKSTYKTDTMYFLNSPRGQAAAQAFTKNGQPEAGRTISGIPLERPNVFRLYEENIGPLTPLIADAVKDAEETYTVEWIEEAIGEAVKNNKRSWKYIEAILKSWKENGRAKKQDRRDAEKDRKQNLDRKIAELRQRSQK